MIYEIDDQIDKIVKRIPVFVFLVYSIGFVAYNCYISSLVGTTFDLINIQYLITGALCVVLFIPPMLTLSFHYQRRSDNPVGIYLNFPHIFYRSFVVGYFCIILLTIDQIGPYLQKRYVITFLLVVIVITISFLVDMYLTSYAARNLRKEIIAIWYLGIVLVQAAIVFIIGSSTIKAYSIIMIPMALIFFVFLGFIADKKTDLRALGLVPILLIIVLYNVGTNILPNISVKYGGFLYSPTGITIKKEFISSIKDMGFEINDNGQILQQRIKLETATSLIIENDYRILKINKDMVLLISEDKTSARKANPILSQL